MSHKKRNRPNPDDELEDEPINDQVAYQELSKASSKQSATPLNFQNCLGYKIWKDTPNKVEIRSFKNFAGKEWTINSVTVWHDGWWGISHGLWTENWKETPQIIDLGDHFVYDKNILPSKDLVIFAHCQVIEKIMDDKMALTSFPFEAIQKFYKQQYYQGYRWTWPNGNIEAPLSLTDDIPSSKKICSDYKVNERPNLITVRSNKVFDGKEYEIYSSTTQNSGWWKVDHTILPTANPSPFGDDITSLGFHYVYKSGLSNIKVPSKELVVTAHCIVVEQLVTNLQNASAKVVNEFINKAGMQPDYCWSWSDGGKFGAPGYEDAASALAEKTLKALDELKTLDKHINKIPDFRDFLKVVEYATGKKIYRAKFPYAPVYKGQKLKQGTYTILAGGDTQSQPKAWLSDPKQYSFWEVKQDWADVSTDGVYSVSELQKEFEKKVKSGEIILPGGEMQHSSGYFRNPDASLRDLERTWSESHEIEDYLIWQNAANRAGQRNLSVNLPQAIGLWVDKCMGSTWWSNNRDDRGYTNWTFYKSRTSYPENVVVGDMTIFYATHDFRPRFQSYDPDVPPPAFYETVVTPLPRLRISFTLTNFPDQLFNPLTKKDIAIFLECITKLQTLIACDIKGRLTFELYKTGPVYTVSSDLFEEYLSSIIGHWPTIMMQFWKEEDNLIFNMYRIHNPDKKVKLLVQALLDSITQLGWQQVTRQPPET